MSQQHLLIFDKTTVYESLFIKLKSVTEYPDSKILKEKNPEQYKMFLEKFKDDTKSDLLDEDIENKYQTEVIYLPEFSRVVAICFGYYHIDEENERVEKQIKSIIKENEVDTLKIFWQVLDRAYRSNKNKILVGHNLFNYDIPFYIKRFVKHRENLKLKDNEGSVHNLGVPNIFKKLLIAKPWEQVAVDTSYVWRFGSVGKNPSLDEIANYFGYKRDSDEISSMNINSHYWNSEDKEKAMKEIACVGSSDIEIMMDFMTEMRTL
jgi:hypothetical protein